jgi:hypothetical protein
LPELVSRLDPPIKPAAAERVDKSGGEGLEPAMVAA